MVPGSRRSVSSTLEAVPPRRLGHLRGQDDFCSLERIEGCLVQRITTAGRGVRDRRCRQIALAMADLHAAPFDLDFDLTEAAVPFCVRRVVAEHVADTRIVDRPPHGAAQIVGVEVGAPAGFLSDDLHGVGHAPYGGQSGELCCLSAARDENAPISRCTSTG